MAKVITESGGDRRVESFVLVEATLLVEGDSLSPFPSVDLELRPIRMFGDRDPDATRVRDGQVLRLTMDEARSIAALLVPALCEGLDGASVGTAGRKP